MSNQKSTIMEHITTSSITPSTDNLIFVVDHDWFGYIDDSPENFCSYKPYEVRLKEYTSCGYTFAISYEEAILKLHAWIRENKEILNKYPKGVFTIHSIDGSYDTKRDRTKLTKVYSISAAKAKKYLF